MLLVHGKDDVTILIEDARAILTSCPEPDLTLLEIDGAGHDSLENIERRGEQLISFLREQGSIF